MPTLSIIIRYFERNQFIAEAIESVVLAGEYSDWEIIVVDDGSVHRFDVMPFSYLGNKIRCVRIDHSGRGEALNQGLKHSKSPWVLFLDDDDKLDKAYFKFVLPYLNQADIDLIIYGYNYFGSQLRIQKMKLFPFHINRLLDGYELPVIHAMLMRRELIIKAGGIDSELNYAEDWDLWLRMALCQPRSVYIQECLAYVRIHENNACHQELLCKQGRLRVIEKLAQDLSSEIKILIKFDRIQAFRRIITGWYEVKHGFKKEGRSHLIAGATLYPLFWFLSVCLLILSFLPIKLCCLITKCFEQFTGRKSGYSLV